MIDCLSVLTVLAKGNDESWWIVLIIFGVIVGLFFLGGIVSVIKDIPRKIESRQKDKVKSCSRLYRGIQALNSGKRSIKGKKFIYKSTGYVFIRTYKEWQAYEKIEYIRNNRRGFKQDFLNLQLFVDDCAIYQECISELWEKYKADPKAITESGLSSQRFVELENELCKALVLPIPEKPELRYDITVECGYQRRKKHFYLERSEIESVLESPTPYQPSPEPKPEVQKTSPEKAKAEEPYTPNFVFYRGPINTTPEPISSPARSRDDASGIKPEIIKAHAATEAEQKPMSSADTPIIQEEKPNSRPTPVPEDTIPTGENGPHQDVKVKAPFGPKALDDPFDRYFDSIDNLERDGLFWARLEEKEKTIIKYVARIVFDLKVDLIPTNGINTFGFRKRSSESNSQRSLFWFKKDQELVFMCQKSFDTFDAASIIATNENCVEMQAQILSLLNSKPNKIPQESNSLQVGNDSFPVTTNEKPIKSKGNTTSAQEQPALSDIKAPRTQEKPKTQAEINHESVLSKYPNLNLDNESLFYKRLAPASQEVIDTVLLLATGMNRKIVAKNDSGTFGFGRSDDPQNGYSWFGFRQRLGESLTFFYREDRYSSKVSTTIANKYQLDLISQTVRRIVNKDYSIPVRKPEPKQDAPAVQQPAQDNSLPLDTLNDPARFYFNCTGDEKALIIRIANLSLSLNKAITFGNTKGYFGYKKKWVKDEATQYWYWFRKPEGKKMSFAYRPSHDSSQVINVENAINSEQAKRIENIVECLLLNKPIVQPKSAATPAVGVKTIDIPPNLVTAIDSPSYFFKRLKPSEQQLVASVIKFVKEHWPNISAENTKNFLGFRTGSTELTNPFWFWFKKPEGYSMQFVYRTTASDPNKKTLMVSGASTDSIVEVLREILPDKENISQTHQTIKQSSDTTHIAKPKSAEEDDFWERPYLYTTEIMKKCGMKGAVATADIAAICTLHHYTYGAGVAFNNKYKSFADAIYQSRVVNSPNKIYVYSNPYNCQTYDRALQKLLDELRLFDLGGGRYLTCKALEADNGISFAECHKFRDMVKRYLSGHHFFSLDSIREYCADCRFLEFGPSDRLVMQFVRSVLGHWIKTIITDQDSPKAVYSTGFGKEEMHLFFTFIMENAPSMEIYEIKDRVETLFAVNYSLDLIGKDAEKAGFFYSEDFEKVYKSKKDFYKEIQG